MNKHPKYLYIVSSPHGGSTMVSLVLGNHRRGENLGEVSFIPKLLSLGELCTCGAKLRECAHWGEVFDELEVATGQDMRASPYGLFLGDALKGKDGSGLIDHAYQTPWRYAYGKARGALDTMTLLATPRWLGMGATRIPSVRQGVRNTIALYAAAAKAHGLDLVVDASKMPRKAPHLYHQDRDNVRILHLVRDGRGVAASRKKYMKVERAAERWNHYHRLTRDILDKWVPPEHRMRLRYEDFTANPEAKTRELLAWLGVEFDPDMLKLAPDQVMHSAGGNPARFELGGGIRSADERWRTSLDEEDLAVFDRIGGALNREFGYR